MSLSYKIVFLIFYVLLCVIVGNQYGADALVGALLASLLGIGFLVRHEFSWNNRTGFNKSKLIGIVFIVLLVIIIKFYIAKWWVCEVYHSHFINEQIILTIPRRFDFAFSLTFSVLSGVRSASCDERSRRTLRSARKSIVGLIWKTSMGFSLSVNSALIMKLFPEMI